MEHRENLLFHPTYFKQPSGTTGDPQSVQDLVVGLRKGVTLENPAQQSYTGGMLEQMQAELLKLKARVAELESAVVPGPGFKVINSCLIELPAETGLTGREALKVFDEELSDEELEDDDWL